MRYFLNQGALSMQRRRLVISVLTAALALLAAGPASAATVRGTVVHKNRSAHKFVVATSSGRLVVVHSQRGASVGRVVRVTGTKLRNGSYSARSIRSAGARRHARLRGTVTYASRSKKVFTISTRGASVLVHQKRLRGRSARAAADTLPAPGQQVAVDTTIDNNDDLEADDVQNQGQDTNGMELEGKLLAVDEANRQLTVAADDDDQSGGSVLVKVPDSFDIKQFQVGNEVELKVTQQPDGTFLLSNAESDNENDSSGDSSDENKNNANKTGGDQKNSADQQGNGQNDD
jgi:ribosomal protein L34E